MNLKTTLLKHQQDAVAKMIRSRIGALFMEMGTGKSRTAIELACRRRGRISKAVWFCPVSLKETICREIEKHTGNTDIYVFGNKTNECNMPQVFWYVIGIESMSASSRIVLTANVLIDEKAFVIVDESQYIKGHRSARTNWITNISRRALYRMILTGTPISQGVVDLFAQMRFLSPKILGYNSFYSFAHNHLEYSEKYPGLIVRSHNTEYLAAKIKPYVYQVTKKECLDLPDKLYETRYFSMTDEQREAYEQAKWEILETIVDDQFDSIAIFRLFSSLQQIVSGFWNYREREGDEPKQLEFSHLRIQILNDIINQIPNDEKIIIWAKYRYDIEQISANLTESYGPESVALFYGDLSIEKRNEQVDMFRGDARFFVATPSCGGHGLTLNEAAYVIFYNNGFKYAERIQAEDRDHRIGQNRNVTYIDIACVDSIDERINDALASKGNVVEAFKKEVDKVKKHNKLKSLIQAL